MKANKTTKAVVLPELQEIFPGFSQGAEQIILKSLQAEGFNEVLHVWKPSPKTVADRIELQELGIHEDDAYVILDGIKRYLLCQSHGISIPDSAFVEVKLNNFRECIHWRIQHNIARLHLSRWQRCEAALNLKEEYSFIGKTHMSNGANGEPWDTLKELSKDFDVSKTTLQNYERIKSSDTDVLKLVHDGEMSISAAFNKVYGPGKKQMPGKKDIPKFAPIVPSNVIIKGNDEVYNIVVSISFTEFKFRLHDSCDSMLEFARKHPDSKVTVVNVTDVPDAAYFLSYHESQHILFNKLNSKLNCIYKILKSELKAYRRTINTAKVNSL